MPRTLLVAALAAAPFAANAVASPVVEASDRLEVNWSSLKIRFYGEAAAPTPNDDEGLKAAERKAWQDGLAYVAEAVRNLNVSVYEDLIEDQSRLSTHASEAARVVSTSTFSYNTTYFGDGTVRVHLENALPKALETSVLRFRQREALPPAMTEHTGIVLALNNAVRPRPMYRIVDQAGSVLFEVSDMAEDAFRKNLMGRWYKKPSPAELNDAVGRSPVTIAVTASQDGRFVVDREAWDRAIEGHRVHLVNGTIALILP